LETAKVMGMEKVKKKELAEPQRLVTMQVQDAEAGKGRRQ